MTLDFWFEFASTYSYLTVARIEAVARAAEVSLRWRPFLLGPIFREQGWDDSPFNLYPVKGRYMWRDMERLADGYGLPFTRPTTFPRNGLLAARVACAALQESWLPEFVRGIYHANFAEDRDISEPDVVARVLEGVSQAPQEWLERAGAAATKARLREHTQEATRLGIFGAPSFAVGEEIFWGNDRLGDAIAWCRLGGAG
ncbi:MAG: 2-hydroxychromene-2-carboxylate isomerase [Proteobacteria bacterium]|nr:2-hydroxychromene-2-carboxylate isomerase [Pseudomonadota bacterium]